MWLSPSRRVSPGVARCQMKPLLPATMVPSGQPTSAQWPRMASTMMASPGPARPGRSASRSGTASPPKLATHTRRRSGAKAPAGPGCARRRRTRPGGSTPPSPPSWRSIGPPSSPTTARPAVPPSGLRPRGRSHCPGAVARTGPPIAQPGRRCSLGDHTPTTDLLKERRRRCRRYGPHKHPTAGGRRPGRLRQCPYAASCAGERENAYGPPSGTDSRLRSHRTGPQPRAASPQGRIASPAGQRAIRPGPPTNEAGSYRSGST